MSEKDQSLSSSRKEILDLFKEEYYHQLEERRHLFQRNNYFQVTISAFFYLYYRLFIDSVSKHAFISNQPLYLIISFGVGVVALVIGFFFDLEVLF